MTALLQGSPRHAVVIEAPRPSRSTARVTTKQPMSRSQRRLFLLMAGIWAALSVNFWAWWLRPDHVGSIVLYAVVSASFLYIATLLPSFYLFYLSHMRTPIAPDAAEGEDPVGAVAVITLTVPGSEALDIVRRQLKAMASITRAHDSWILVDKEHSPEIEQLAAEVGVRYFSRHDVARWGPDAVERWNAPAPPFQAKTKAGNVNSWLDAHGADYSHFTQLDIDHEPVPEYLDRVLPYFIDPAVAWVQAPSVYGNHDHWTALGSTEQEFVLQGPLQMGFFGFSRTPMIIGSHCTYDRAAIDRIGGFAPTRAEDHLDTVLLAAEKREGVFLPEIIATGDGPETFQTYLAQQFAWAFSMFQVLFTYTPRLVREYTRRQALQFLFVQTWYLLWSMAMLALFLAPLAALTLDVPISHVSLPVFYLHSVPLGIMSMVVWRWSRHWFQPMGMGLTWRGIVLHIARWVVVVSALVQVILRVKKPYMITVKGIGGDGLGRYSVKPLLPYVALAASALVACWLYIGAYGRSHNQGYLFFALMGAGLFAVLLQVVLFQEIKTRRAAGAGAVRSIRSCTAAVAIIALLDTGVLATAATCAGRIADAFLS